MTFSDLRATGSGVITTGVDHNLTVSPLVLSQQLLTRLHVALAPGSHTTGPRLR